MNSGVEKGKANEQMMIFESVLKWRNVFTETLLAEQTLLQICLGQKTHALSLQSVFKLRFSRKLMLWYLNTIFFISPLTNLVDGAKRIFGLAPNLSETFVCMHKKIVCRYWEIQLQFISCNILYLLRPIECMRAYVHVVLQVWSTLFQL